jgi:hypothetical protein
MRYVFNGNNNNVAEKERQEWAYNHFATMLYIHSLWLNDPYKKEIQEIALKWSIVVEKKTIGGSSSGTWKMKIDEDWSD